MLFCNMMPKCKKKTQICISPKTRNKFKSTCIIFVKRPVAFNEIYFNLGKPQRRKKLFNSNQEYSSQNSSLALFYF